VILKTFEGNLVRVRLPPSAPPSATLMLNSPDFLFRAGFPRQADRHPGPGVHLILEVLAAFGANTHGRARADEDAR
jgi:hypothetical protein